MYKRFQEQKHPITPNYKTYYRWKLLSKPSFLRWNFFSEVARKFSIHFTTIFKVFKISWCHFIYSDNNILTNKFTKFEFDSFSKKILSCKIGYRFWKSSTERSCKVHIKKSFKNVYLVMDLLSFPCLTLKFHNSHQAILDVVVLIFLFLQKIIYLKCFMNILVLLTIYYHSGS